MLNANSKEAMRHKVSLSKDKKIYIGLEIFEIYRSAILAGNRILAIWRVG